MSTKKLQRPSITVQCQGANQYATNDERKVLIIGEVSGGSGVIPTAIIDRVLEDVNALDTPEIFGADSQLNLAIQRFKKINPLVQLDILPVVEGGASATATLTPTFLGALTEATVASVMTINIGGHKRYINVAVGDLLLDVATKIVDIYADDPLITVTLVGETGVFSYKQGTASVNDVPLVITQNRVSGIDIVEQKFAGGASVQIPYALDSVLFERYTSIILDDVLGIDILPTYTESVCNLTNEIRDGVGFVMQTGTIPLAKAFASLHNEKTLVSFYNLEEMKYNIYTLEAMSEIVAIRELRFRTGANVGDYVVDFLENYGGINKATLPYFNTPLTFGKPKGFITEADLTLLIEEGISLFTTCCNRTVLSEVVTLYKTNEAGNRDYSWHFLNYVDTMSVIREFIVNNLRQRFSQTRMTDGDLVAGVSMANNGSLKSALVRLSSILADKGRNHEKGIIRTGFVDFITENITIQQDLTLGLWNFKMSVPIVTQVRTIQGTLVEVLDVEFSLGQQY